MWIRPSVSVPVQGDKEQPGGGDDGHGEGHHVLFPLGEQLALLHGPLVKVVDAYPGQGYFRSYVKKARQMRR